MPILKLQRFIIKYALLTIMLTMMSVQKIPSKEYQVKAVFLFNFAQFVEWPEKAFIQKDTPLIIGVLGEDPFGSFLEEIIYNEKVEEHPLTIQYFNDINTVGDCHILFVSADKISQMQSKADVLKAKNVLTVGDTDDFISKGGAIQFFLDEGRIRLQINTSVAKASELKISSKLLRLAKIEKD